MMFKRIVLLLVVVLFSANFAFAEWKQVAPGTYVDGFNRNGNYITYSTKVYKTSSMWQQYMNAHNFTAENMGNFDSMIINSTYDCAASRIKVDSVQMYDTSGNQMGAFVDNTWKDDYQGSGRVMCSMTQGY